MPSDPDSPKQVGRYEVVRELGKGSTGVVYLARDPLIGRLVALKTLPASVRGSEGLEGLRRRFLHEAQRAGGLSHPGIVTVHDILDGGDGGRVCIAMEYVPGRTLREILASPEPISLDLVTGVVQQIAEVLDFAHERGIVHRDIKPANVLITDDLRVKVTDFGIASIRGGDLAHDLAAMGTPNYLAPERLLGQEVDHRADVYSLGVILYELLTRHLPFQGDSLAELARNTVTRDYTPPEIHRPDLTPAMRRILSRALEKDPENRYPTAGELAADLRGLSEQRSRDHETQPIPEHATEPPAAAPPPIETAPGEIEAWEGAPPETGADRLRRLGGRLLAGTGAFAAVTLSGLAAGVRRLFALPLSPLRAALLTTGAIGLLIVATLPLWLPRPAPLNPTAAPVVGATQQARRLEYLALLKEVQELYDAGDREAADRLLQRAEVISPEAARIRALRAEVERELRLDRAGALQAQVVGLVDAAEEAIARGDLATAEAALFKIEEIEPDNELAAALRGELDRELAELRQARQRRRERLATLAPEPAESAPAEPALETRRVEPTPPPPTDPLGTLKIDFYSESPRGVLTLYSGDDQIFRREFRFVERKGFLRKKGIPGGFGDRLRLDRGKLAVRIYLSRPGRATQNLTVTGELPGGGVRTLRIRVDGEGRMRAALL